MSWLLRLLLGESGFGRISVGAAMVIALGGGLGAYYVTAGAPAGSDTANVWMDVGTTTCSRVTTPVNYAGSASPDARCGSVAEACAAAAAGDTVRVRPGSYGSQTTTCDETNWVTYYLDAAATFSSAGGSGEYQKFVGGTITQPSIVVGASTGCQDSPSPPYYTNCNFALVSNHLWFEDNNMTIVGDIFLNDVNNITLIGPGDVEMAPCGATSQNWAMAAFQETYNITVKYFTFHGFQLCQGGDHTEVWRIQSCGSGGQGPARCNYNPNLVVHDVTLEGNTFYDNEDNTSTLFITAGVQGVNLPHDIIIRNNFFGVGGNGLKLLRAQNPNVSTCINYTIEYNSTPTGTNLNTWTDVCTAQNVIRRGNVACGTGFANCASYPNQPDYHITSSATAAYGQGGGTCPATDFDGEVRPQGTCDAGADEIAGP